VAWNGGTVRRFAECVLAPNPSAYTLDGTNTWILGSQSAAIVIDPGPDNAQHRAAIMDRCDERSWTVQAIILTHGHHDHSEGARAYAHATGAPVYSVDPQWRVDGGNPVEVQRFDLGEVEARIIATPGHTSDSVSVAIGDCVLTGDTVLGRGTALVAFPDGDLRSYLESLQRLQDLCAEEEITTLLPGHGPTLEDPQGVLRGYLEHRHARLDEIRAVMKSGIRTPQEIVEVVYADIPREVWPAAEATVRASLDVLRQE